MSVLLYRSIIRWRREFSSPLRPVARGVMFLDAGASLKPGFSGKCTNVVRTVRTNCSARSTATVQYTVVPKGTRSRTRYAPVPVPYCIPFRTVVGRAREGKQVVMMSVYEYGTYRTGSLRIFTTKFLWF